MANLYGRLQGARGEATRIGHSDIRAKLETWNGSIEVVLEKDGTFTVRIGDKHSPRQVVASGNVDTGEVNPVSCHWCDEPMTDEPCYYSPTGKHSEKVARVPIT